jgi:hypothetical protein
MTRKELIELVVAEVDEFLWTADEEDLPKYAAHLLEYALGPRHRVECERGWFFVTEEKE